VPIGPLAEVLTRALARFRVQTAHNLLDEAFAALPADVVARELVLPVFGRIEQEGDRGVQRFAASIFEIRLLAQARGWERIEGPEVTLACGPRDERALELITLGLGLAARQRRVVYLGAATPTAALHGRTIVVAVGGELEPDERADLRARHVLLTGPAAAQLASATGLTALPADPLAALEQLTALTSSRTGDALSPGPA
jgi:hypothetical protein